MSRQLDDKVAAHFAKYPELLPLAPKKTQILAEKRCLCSSRKKSSSGESGAARGCPCIRQGELLGLTASFGADLIVGEQAENTRIRSGSCRHVRSTKLAEDHVVRRGHGTDFGFTFPCRHRRGSIELIDDEQHIVRRNDI